MTALNDPHHEQCLVGVDVGGTKCAGGLVRFPDGSVLTRRLQPTLPNRDGNAVLADVIELIVSLQRQAAEIGVEIGAIGLGIAELVGVDGQILSAATIHWEGMTVDQTIRSVTGLPVVLEADVRAAARAEANLGSGRPFRNFLYITVGTGISACLVVDRTPYVGARGLTGTFASSPGLIPAEDDCLMAGPPLEQFSAGPALAARLASARPGFTGTARDVLSLADAGESMALAITISAGEALGAAVGQLVNMLDPEAVVIGGGLGLAEGQYRHSVETAMRRHIWSDVHRHVPFLLAEMGNDAGIIGAALAASRL